LTVGVGRDHWKELCNDIADIAERPMWQRKAACRRKPPAMFFPTVSNTGRYDQRTAAAALELCRRCPVRDECLAAAVGRGEKFGVWGGRVFGT